MKALHTNVIFFTIILSLMKNVHLLPQIEEHYVDNSDIFSIDVSEKVADGYNFDICAKHADICQIKLDFLSLRLDQPDNNGICVSEQLTINGYDKSVKVPVLCGNNDGQHVYLPLKANKEVIKVRINSNKATDWKIKATQISCSDNHPLQAPTGCLQQYSVSPGEVMSFNYNGGQHLADQNYNICLAGTSPCTITWTETDGTIDISPHTPYPYDGGCDFVSDILTVLTGTMDYNGQERTFTTLCGERTMEPNMVFNTQFVNPALTVYFDGNEDEENNQADTTLGRKGFKLSYSYSC